MPARPLWPWEVLGRDLEDLKQVPISTGNRYTSIGSGGPGHHVRTLLASPPGFQGLLVRGAEHPDAAGYIRRAAIDQEWRRGGSFPPSKLQQLPIETHPKVGGVALFPSAAMTHATVEVHHFFLRFLS